MKEKRENKKENEVNGIEILPNHFYIDNMKMREENDPDICVSHFFINFWVVLWTDRSQ